MFGNLMFNFYRKAATIVETPKEDFVFSADEAKKTVESAVSVSLQEALDEIKNNELHKQMFETIRKAALERKNSISIFNASRVVCDELAKIAKANGYTARVDLNVYSMRKEDNFYIYISWAY